jgi:hypothetical protein
MTHTPTLTRNNDFTLRLLRAAICGLALPLATVGCQHNQPATTQVVMSAGASGGSASASVQSPGMMDQLGAQARQHGHEVAVETRATLHDMAEQGRQTGHDIAQGSRAVGHGVAQASRASFAAVSDHTGEFPSSAVDIATNSAVRLRNTPPESLTAPVIDVDQAMQLRDWDRMTAIYSSGATVAGPTGFLYQPRPGQNLWRYQVVDIPIFLVNTALLPYAFAKTPPWKPVEWKAATVEPTYTGVPPLPPE